MGARVFCLLIGRVGIWHKNVECIVVLPVYWCGILNPGGA